VRRSRRPREEEAEAGEVAEDAEEVVGVADSPGSEEKVTIPKKPRPKQTPANLESRLESLTRMYTSDQAREEEGEADEDD
ncbi:MAG: hypothetical protein V3S10_01385, partial [Dehalococcoidales bacterium]